MQEPSHQLAHSLVVSFLTSRIISLSCFIMRLSLFALCGLIDDYRLLFRGINGRTMCNRLVGGLLKQLVKLPLISLLFCVVSIGSPAFFIPGLCT